MALMLRFLLLPLSFKDVCIDLDKSGTKLIKRTNLNDVTRVDPWSRWILGVDDKVAQYLNCNFRK